MRDPALPRVYLVTDASPREVTVIRLDFDGETRSRGVTAFHDGIGKFGSAGAKGTSDSLDSTGALPGRGQACVPASTPHRDGGSVCPESQMAACLAMPGRCPESACLPSWQTG